MKGVKTTHCLDINDTTKLIELHYDDLDFELGPGPYYSLLSQTYTNWEWIIIDDSKTDDTWNKLKAFAENDYRIKVYRRPQNDGSIGKIYFFKLLTKILILNRMNHFCVYCWNYPIIIV